MIYKNTILFGSVCVCVCACNFFLLCTIVPRVIDGGVGLGCVACSTVVDGMEL